MRTSLGIASRGMLDRGDCPSLHIATRGMLRKDDLVELPGGSGAADVIRGSKLRRLRMEDEEILAVIIAATERDRTRGL